MTDRKSIINWLSYNDIVINVMPNKLKFFIEKYTMILRIIYSLQILYTSLWPHDGKDIIKTYIIDGYASIFR